MFFNPNNYPDVLPSLLRQTAFELHSRCGVPMELAAPLVVGAASLACQGAIDVSRPNCEPSPCLLYTLVVAGSGTRKSTVLNKLLAPFHEMEQELSAGVAERMPEFEAASLAWEIQKKSLLNQIERKTKKNESMQPLQDQLAAHMAARPVVPTAPKFVYEDPTPEAVVDGLCKVWHSAGMVSSEGGGFLNGRPSYDLPMWNKIWDGAGLAVERIGRGTSSSRDARASLILAVQEGPFQEFCDRRGAEALDIGFLARFLVSRPPRIVGNRFIYQNNVEATWEALKKFQHRIKELLKEQVANSTNGKFKRMLLTLSPKAEQRWIEAFNLIESLLRPGEYLSCIPGYASKIAENAVRIAAVFHYFEGKEGNIIQYEEVDRALRLCEWHADQFLACFGPPAQIPIEQRDAQILEAWLHEFVWNAGRPEVKKNDVRQSGPNPLRNKVRLDNAVQVLIYEHKIRIVLTSNKTRLIQLNPDYFSTRIWTGKNA